MKRFKNFFYCIFVLLFLASCTEGEINEIEPIVERELSSELLRLKSNIDKTTNIVRDMIIEENSIVDDISLLIKEEKYDDDYIKFKDLFKDDVVYKISSPNQKFKDKFNEIYQRKTRSKYSYNLQEYLVDNNMVIYEPYPLEEYGIIRPIPTIVGHPVTNDIRNIGYEPQPSGGYEEVMVDEDYARNYPVWIIKQVSPEENSNPAAATPQIKKFWLKKNVSPDYVKQNDVMLTVIPEMKLTENYVGLFTGASKVYFYKVYGKVSSASSNTVANFDTGFGKFGFIKFKRKDVRKKRWVGPAVTFDDDWDMTESNVMLAVISSQGLFSGARGNEATFTGSIEIGYDLAKNKPSTTTKQSVNYSHKVGKKEIKRPMLRYKDKISRRSALANVVGDQFLHGTYENDGVMYTVRAADKIRYYFKHNITKVDD